MTSFVLLTIIYHNSYSQSFTVYVNDDLVLNNSIYNYYPNSIDIKIGGNNLDYKIISGEFSLYESNGKKRLYFKPIQELSFENFSGCYSGNKFLIEIKKIQNIKTGIITDYDRFLVFKLSENYQLKINKYFDILINNNLNYKLTGIQKDETVTSFKIMSGKYIFSDTVKICQIRTKIIAEKIVSKKELESSKDINIFKSGFPGDRFVITLINKIDKAERVTVIPIN